MKKLMRKIANRVYYYYLKFNLDVWLQKCKEINFFTRKLMKKIVNRVKLSLWRFKFDIELRRIKKN